MKIELVINTDVLKMRKSGWIVVNHFLEVLKITYRQAMSGDFKDYNEIIEGINPIDKESKIKLLKKLFRVSNTITCDISKNRLHPSKWFNMRLGFIGHDLLIISTIHKAYRGDKSFFLKVIGVSFIGNERKF